MSKLRKQQRRKKMYQTRAKVTKKIPIVRKGTRYVARSRVDLQNSVPVVLAIRDMLHLARTSKEVKKMINQKLLKINGKEVKDYRDSIRLFNILEADKTYLLTFLPTGRFVLEPTKEKERPCKVLDKKILKGKKVQLNLHDGTNVLSSEKISTNDTIYLDFSGKIKKHVSFEKGKECFIVSGKYIGNKGKIQSVKEKVKVKLKDKEVELHKRSVMAL